MLEQPLNSRGSYTQAPIEPAAKKFLEEMDVDPAELISDSPDTSDDTRR